MGRHRNHGSGIQKIYVASSWRNARQPNVVQMLRSAGFEVYDFRNPGPGQRGFSWTAVDPEWKRWSPADFRTNLSHPVARSGFSTDLKALRAADATVLVLPCGSSAHMELGYAAGLGQPTFILCDATLEDPELMYSMATKICLTVEELVAALCQVHTDNH